MPALERLVGIRVVADPAALDAARWTAPTGVDVTVLRINADDAFAIGATGVELGDPHAIVEPEVGFVGGWGSTRDLERHAEWTFPTARPALAQGSLAGVPARIWLPDPADPADPDRAFLVATAAAAATLADRIGWTLG